MVNGFEPRSFVTGIDRSANWANLHDMNIYFH